jgi:hypothetical protein
MCLGHLHQVTTAISQYLLDSSSGFSRKQHIAVHFCLAFFIISGFEFYRAYINVKKFDPGLDPIEYFLRGNVEPNHVFPVSRDPVGFSYVKQVAEPDFAIFSKSNDLQIGQWLLFWGIDGLANLLLKRIVNRSSGDGKDLLWVMMGMNVFFTTDNGQARFLNLPLLRVVRQAKHVAFWTMVGVVQRRTARAEAHDESSSYDDKQVRQASTLQLSISLYVICQ